MLRVLCLLLLAGPAIADPPRLKELSPAPKVDPKPNDPIPVLPGTYRFYGVEGYTGSITWVSEGTSVGMKEVVTPLQLFGVVSGQTDPGEYPVPAGALIVWGKEQGVTSVQAWGVVSGKAKMLLALKFLVGPAPPKPDVKPDVDPSVDPAPISAPGFRVLITFDAQNPSSRTEAQNQIIYGAAVRDYLNKNCVVGSDGKTSEARMWPSNADVSAAEKHWKDAFAKSRSSPNWVYISNGKTGYGGPLPASDAAMLELLKKYRGQ